jgi:ABC-type long-subunit fatty acid transport system fused permease/ATPase subunit
MSTRGSTGGAGGDAHRTPPYAFGIAAIALFLATLVFMVVMWIFQDEITNGAVVTTALSTLFGVFGTVVGAYFGIKLSSDTADKTRGETERARAETERANDKTNRALAALDPAEAEARGLL